MIESPSARPIYILNGPNLNRLGTREPHIYGSTTLADIEAMCHEEAGETPIVFRQSNREYELVDWIQEAIDEADAIIINPAGLTFTSVPIMDALKMFDRPSIELHISNVHKREAIYHKSLMSAVVTSVIAGLGPRGYRIAIKAVRELLAVSSG